MATYSVSCLTKHSSNYYILMVGRVLGGIATSLLFSAFESWVVGEHLNRGFDPKWLGETFSKVRARRRRRGGQGRRGWDGCAGMRALRCVCYGGS